MSRPWSNALTIGIAPDGIALETSQQTVRMLSKERIAFDSHDELQQTFLAHADALKGQTLNVVLSNALVRYLVMPWQAELDARADWKAIAQKSFSQQYGVDAIQWQTRVSLSAYGAPVVASAMHGNLLDSLNSASHMIGFNVQSVVPAGIGLLNQLALEQHHWMLIAEPEYLLLCMRDKTGAPVDFVVTTPPAGDEPAKAAQLVARHTAQTGQPPKQTLVYVSGKLSESWRAHAAAPQLSPVYARNPQHFNAAWLTQLPQ